MKRSILLAAAACLALAFVPGEAAAANEEAVSVSHQGLALNGRMLTPEGAGGPTILLVHGTMGHYGMAVIADTQRALAEHGFASVAVNLGLGIDGRKGPFECATPHAHRHEDAVTEIGAWIDWLKERGVGQIALMGHSRGGNQVAWFATERSDPAVSHLILVAPTTWSDEKTLAGYEARFGRPLRPLREQAAAMVDKGEGAGSMGGVGFMICDRAEVTADSFHSYYKPEPRRHTPGLLGTIAVPVLVISASDDAVVPDLPEHMAPLADGHRIVFETVEGADHFFRDIFADDVGDMTAEFLGR